MMCEQVRRRATNWPSSCPEVDTTMHTSKLSSMLSATLGATSSMLMRGKRARKAGSARASWWAAKAGGTCTFSRPEGSAVAEVASPSMSAKSRKSLRAFSR